jgi:hypothetical protein
MHLRLPQVLQKVHFERIRVLADSYPRVILISAAEEFAPLENTHVEEVVIDGGPEVSTAGILFEERPDIGCPSGTIVGHVSPE